MLSLPGCCSAWLTPGWSVAPRAGRTARLSKPTPRCSSRAPRHRRELCELLDAAGSGLGDRDRDARGPRPTRSAAAGQGPHRGLGPSAGSGCPDEGRPDAPRYKAEQGVDFAAARSSPSPRRTSPRATPRRCPRPRPKPARRSKRRIPKATARRSSSPRRATTVPIPSSTRRDRREGVHFKAGARPAAVALRLLLRRSEYLERPCAHPYGTGRLRRVHVRGRTNILKRLLAHAASGNVGLLMRAGFGVGIPRTPALRRARAGRCGTRSWRASPS
jgi:hypothetical protein